MWTLAKNEVGEVDASRYLTVVEQLLEGLNLGRSFEELLTSVYENLKDLVPYNRIGVAMLDEGRKVLRAVWARSDGETKLNVGYSAALAGSTLEHLLRTGQPPKFWPAVSAFLNSGLLGLAISMVWYAPDREHAYLLVGLCVLAGLGGMTAVDFLVEAFKKGGITIQLKDEAGKPKP